MRFRCHRALAALIVSLSLAPAIRATTVGEIVNANLEMKGGESRLREIRSLRLRSRQLFLHSGDPMDCVTEWKRTGEFRVECTSASQTLLAVFDGKTGWRITTGRGEPVVSRMPAFASCQTSAMPMGPQSPVWARRESNQPIELLGREDVDGVSAYKIKLPLSCGGEGVYYLDPESFLEIKAVVVVSGHEFVQTYRDFADLFGVITPRSIRTETSPTLYQSAAGIELLQHSVKEVDFLDAELNPEIAESRFELPPEFKGRVKP